VNANPKGQGDEKNTDQFALVVLSAGKSFSGAERRIISPDGKWTGRFF